MDNFEIDVAIQGAIPDLTDEEFKQLTENILNDGKVTDPIIVWGNKIVDGFHRWKIIQEHPEIPYTVEYMDFPDEYAAIYWACVRQAGRRNLNRQGLNLIVGTASICAKRSHGGDHGTAHDLETGKFVTATCQIDTLRSGEDKSKHKTWNETAEAFGVTPSFVRHAEDITKAVDLADEAVPGFKEKYKSGDIKASDDMIKKAMKVPEEGREEVASAIKNITIHNTAEEINEGKEQLNSIFKSYTGTDLIDKKESEESKLTFKNNSDSSDNEESESSEGIPSFEDWSLQEAMKDPVYAEHADEYGVNQLSAVSSENFERFRAGFGMAIEALQEVKDTDFTDVMFKNDKAIELVNNDFAVVLELINKYMEQIESLNAE